MNSNAADTVRNVLEEKRTFVRSIWIAAALVLLASATLVAKLVDIQVLKHDYYLNRSDENRTKLVPVAPVRGLIYDRNGVQLAQNKPDYVLELTPENVDNMDDTLARLGEVVPLSADDIARFKTRMRQVPRYRAVPIRTHLTIEEVARYEVNRYKFAGVEVNAQLERDYPMGHLTSHLIGYVGGISDADYARLDESKYRGLSQIGKSGIERSHEDDLRGLPGSKLIEINAIGRPLRELAYNADKPGQDLYLSIDTRLQRVAEEAFGDLNGAAVAIDPKTGEVLALVSKPGFEPQPFVEGISNTAYQALLKDPNHPLYNRALLGTYPSGSTIKPFLALGGLHFGKIDPDKPIFDPGYFQLPGVSRKYRDDVRSGFGWLNLDQAIAQSSDVYFYQVAVNLGIDNIDKVLSLFGFGHATGIDLPGEKIGILPSKAWKERVYQQVWYPGDTVNIGIGQGFFTVTPMELAAAVARLAMHGGGFAPHLVREFRNAKGNMVPAKPKALPRVTEIEESAYQRVIHAMEMVTQAPKGTAYAVFKDAPYTVAGKTGTAQVAGLSQSDSVAPNMKSLPKHLRDNGLFVAFAPVDDPKIAVAVVAEHAGWGASSAAPIARKMIDQYLLSEQSSTAANSGQGAATSTPAKPGDKSVTSTATTRAPISPP